MALSCKLPVARGCKLVSMPVRRLAVTATTQNLACTSSLLRPGPFTLSVLAIDASAAGRCIAAGEPSVTLHPMPRLCIPIAASSLLRLSGVPRARGCLSLSFDAGHASLIFRWAACHEAADVHFRRLHQLRGSR